MKKAFTMAELMVVMAIIIIIIAIAVPSLTAARTAAIKTSVKSQIMALDIALESFRKDNGEYIPSNSAQFARNTVDPIPEMTEWEVGGFGEMNGAHLLVDAIIGRDRLGYDRYRSTFTGSPNDYNRWDQNRLNERRRPYIEIDSIELSSFDNPAMDIFGIIPNSLPRPNNTEVEVPVFIDKFGWPILYYRASPTSTIQWPIIQTNINMIYGDGIYDGLDNALFTSYAGGSPHKISDANGALPNLCNVGYNTDDLSSIPNGGTFAEFIRSFRSTAYYNGENIHCPRPVNSDSFILLSAGKDGIYGSIDDVANFDVFSRK